MTQMEHQAELLELHIKHEKEKHDLETQRDVAFEHNAKLFKKIAEDQEEMKRMDMTLRMTKEGKDRQIANLERKNRALEIEIMKLQHEMNDLKAELDAVKNSTKTIICIPNRLQEGKGNG